MKAKDWATKFDTSSDLTVEFKAFIDEIGEVAKKRGGTPNAVEGAVREQRDKLRAIGRLTNKVSPSMFDSLLKEYGEEFKVVEDRYQERYGKGPKAKAVAKPKAEKRQQESKPERRRQPRTPKKAANAA